MSKKETIFREGDRVFDYLHGGWGVIENIRLESIVVRFDSFDLVVSYGFEKAGKKLSFKEYDYVNGGFSQERPMPTISMPFLKNEWKCLTRDEHGLYVHTCKPKWVSKYNVFGKGSGISRYVGALINLSTFSIENDTIYKIIDNDQST